MVLAAAKDVAVQGVQEIVTRYQAGTAIRAEERLSTHLFVHPAYRGWFWLRPSRAPRSRVATICEVGAVTTMH